MQITLNQDEIYEALENHVRSQITVNDNMEIEIDLKAGRGEHGATATLDIQPAKEKAPAKKATKPKVVKAEPKPEPVEEVDEPADESPVEETTEAPVEETIVEDVKVASDGDDTNVDDGQDEAPEQAEEEAPKPRNSIFSKAS